MLTDADRELITAAVDGALPADREAAFRRLVADSADAAALFSRLEADSRRLRALPQVAAPAGLAVAVAERVAALPTAAPYTPAARPARRGSWVPYAAAAAVLLAVAAGSFWVASHDATPESDRLAARRQLPRNDNTPPDRPGLSPAVPAEVARELLPAPRLPSAGPSDQGAVAAVTPSAAPELAPAPRPSVAGDVVGSALTEQKPFETVQVRLPFLAPVADLDRADVRARLLVELAQDPAYRLDLFTRDVHRAAEAFHAAARSAGVHVTADALTQERLRKRLPITVAVYTEALSAEEIARLLGRLADRARSEKGTPFTTAHLVPAQQAEQRELRELLGVDPGLWKRPANGPKPVGAGTVGQVAAALDKTGGKPALMLTLLPPAMRTVPAASKEVKAFLELRDERKPTAVPLLIVIRPAG